LSFFQFFLLSAAPFIMLLRFLQFCCLLQEALEDLDFSGRVRPLRQEQNHFNISLYNSTSMESLLKRIVIKAVNSTSVEFYISDLPLPPPKEKEKPSKQPESTSSESADEGPDVPPAEPPEPEEEPASEPDAPSGNDSLLLEPELFLTLTLSPLPTSEIQSSYLTFPGFKSLVEISVPDENSFVMRFFPAHPHLAGHEPETTVTNTHLTEVAGTLSALQENEILIISAKKLAMQRPGSFQMMMPMIMMFAITPRVFFFSPISRYSFSRMVMQFMMKKPQQQEEEGQQGQRREGEASGTPQEGMPSAAEAGPAGGHAHED
jgi:hypothetical protein